MTNTIKSVRVKKLTEDLSGVSIEEINIAPPRDDEVQVDIMACALNFPDLLMCRGGYQFKPDLPFTPGMEAAGRIIECGAGVKEWRVGDEVSIGGRGGMMAEKINLPISAPAALTKKSPHMDWAEASAWAVAWRTAWVALAPRGHLRKGETLLVLGAAGGVGMAAVEVGKLIGAKVIATASSEEKRAIIKTRGADVVLAPDDGLASRVKQANGGEGVDVVYDPVGGDMFDRALRCLKWHGRLLVIGFASGRWPVLPVNYALIKGLSIIGVRAGEFGRRDPEQGRAVEAHLQQWAQEGKIKPYIGAKFPLARAIEALQFIEQRRAIGKVCLMIGE